MLVRETSTSGYDLALASADVAASPRHVIARVQDAAASQLRKSSGLRGPGLSDRPDSMFEDSWFCGAWEVTTMSGTRKDRYSARVPPASQAQSIRQPGPTARPGPARDVAQTACPGSATPSAVSTVSGRVTPQVPTADRAGFPSAPAACAGGVDLVEPTVAELWGLAPDVDADPVDGMEADLPREVLVAGLAEEAVRERWVPPELALAFPAGLMLGGVGADAGPGGGGPGGGGFCGGGVLDEMAPGAVLAGFAGDAQAAGLGVLSDDELTGVLCAWRRLGSWAAAGQFTAVSELAARRAAEAAELGQDLGRALLAAEAELACALTLTQRGAQTLLDRAGDLARLPGTAAALAAGVIDEFRARVIADQLADLDVAAARRVEVKLLERAGAQTSGQLRAACVRAVFAADPGAVRRRRERAQREARVETWQEPSGTASIAGRDLPPADVLAADKRIDALARRLKKAGADAGLDQLRAGVYVSLLTGAPLERLLTCAASSGTAENTAAATAGTSPPEHPGAEPASGPGPAPDPAPDPQSASGPGPGLAQDSGPALGPQPPSGPGPGLAQDSGPAHGSGPAPDPGSDPQPAPDRGPAPDPGPGSGAGPDPGLAHDSAPAPGGGPDLGSGQGPEPVCGPRPAFGAGGWLDGQPGLVGRINLTLPLATLLGSAEVPGEVGGFGPVDAPTARQLAGWAAGDPATRWCITLTGPDGQVVGHGCATPGRARAPDSGPRARTTGRRGSSEDTSGPGEDPDARGGPAAGGGGGPAGTGGGGPGGARNAGPGASAGPAASAGSRGDSARSDDASGGSERRWHLEANIEPLATGGCTHQREVPGYTPPPSLRHLIEVRDKICSFPTCRRTAEQCDLDHTLAYHNGGRTCPCNLHPLCRRHHEVKQAQGWQLTQPEPGILCWTTPSGRSYRTTR